MFNEIRRSTRVLRRDRYGRAVMGLLLAGAAQTAVAQGNRNAGTARVVNVVARDFSLEMPDTLRGGLATLRLRNEGKEPHHVMLFRIDSGRSQVDVESVLAHDGTLPGWMHPVGGPNAVIGARQSVLTVALTPGAYVAYCFIPSRDGVLHVSKGMLRMLTVLPDIGVQGRVPRGDVTITLVDYGFRLSRPLTAGHHRITVTNEGTQAHELILSRLAAGKRSADFVRWIERHEGPPPVEPYGGVTDIAAGATVMFEVDLTPGRYSFLCRVRDARDGQPHDRRGMTADIVVRK